jgi:TetR/AcrR family transcriptional regulator
VIPTRPTARARNTARRRDGEKEHRRQHILDAAEQIFARRPYDEASMQEIAQSAGIGMNGLYGLFPSKEELFGAVVCCRLEEIRARLPTPKRGDDPISRAYEMAKAYAAFFLERPQFFPVFAAQRLAARWHLSSRFTRSTHPLVEEVEAELSRAIGEAIKAERIASHDPALLTEVAMGIFVSVLQHRLLSKQPGDAASCADEMLALFLRGAGGAP